MEQMINTSPNHKIGTSATLSTDNQLVMVGPISGGTKIREAFERLSFDNVLCHLADLGDLHISARKQLGSVILELSEMYSTSLICTSSCAHDTLDQEFWDAYHKPVVISPRPHFSASHIKYIGLQKHSCNKDFDFAGHLRLGDARARIEHCEVLLRTADLVLVDLSSIRLSDNLGCSRSSTAGLMIEEMCKILRYAGASTAMRTIVIYGYDQNHDLHQMMAQNIALCLYYILDGYGIKLNDAQSDEQLQSYTVLPDLCSTEMVFYEDKRNGRWWVKLYSDAAETEVKVPCSRKDYEEACNNQISDHLAEILTLV